MKALHTDLYQLTMAAGYSQAGKAAERGTFELFVRRLPKNRDFLLAAGLEQAVDYLLNLRFTGEQIDYLRGLPPFERVSERFWEHLLEFRFTGDLFAMAEGTPFFAGEPIAIVRAPLLEAQIPETYLLATIGFQSMIASKAARVAAAAEGRPVIEFGSRRAQSPEAGVLAGRAAYIGGCAGTSNVEAGFRYGIPVYGTSAHSWVLAFEDESTAFSKLQDLLGARTTYLIDSYDTIKGARKAVALGPPLSAVRLDSGDLVSLSRQVRRILDEGGMRAVQIMATNDLNEDRVAELVKAGAPIDSFGVGTDLATSADAPSLSVVYKLAEHEAGGTRRYTAKYSRDKQTLPGAKQVFRYADRDVVACSGEQLSGGEALLHPVISNGKLVGRRRTASEARAHAGEALKQLSPGHRMEYSPELQRLLAAHLETHP